MSDETEEKLRLRAIEFIGKVYMSNFNEDQQVVVTSTLAMVLFATDEEWQRFIFSTDMEQRMRDSVAAVERLHEEYEAEGLRRDLLAIEKFGINPDENS